MFHATFAISAHSPKVFFWSGEPFTTNAPSFHSRSDSLASRRCAATFFALSLNALRRDVHGRPADRGRAAAVGPPSLRRIVGVAGDDLDILDRKAELVGDDLREGGFLTLAVRPGADVDAHNAGGIDPDRCALSYSPPPNPTAPATCDGPRPQISQ